MTNCEYELIIENTDSAVFRGIILKVEFSETFPDGVRSVEDIMEITKTYPHAANYLATFSEHRKPKLVNVPSDVNFGRARTMKARVKKIVDHFTR